MVNKGVKLAVFFMGAMFFCVGVASAQEYSLDISGLKTDDYSIGEEINFQIVALKGGELTSGLADILVSDLLGKVNIRHKLNVNEDQRIIVGSEFPSGLWTIKASLGDAEVERTFNVGENSDVEFALEGDELVIKNTGNVRYTRTLRIKIGDVVNSYVQNIGVGEEKRLKLVSPDGNYNIEVTDGKKTLRRENVALVGTGNVIGAVDKDLVGYTGFAGAGDLRGAGDQGASLSKLPVSLVFIGAVMILGILVALERRMAKKAKKRR